MRILKSYWILIAATTALILLVVFQLNWLRQSRELVEEQFDQKVTMALCSISETLSKELTDEEMNFLCKTEELKCGSGYVETDMNEQRLEQVLDSTLAQYAIDLDYSFNIVPVSGAGFPFSNPPNGYSCSVGPNSDLMKINFLGRDDYVREKLGWMTGASILLLVSVGILFLITSVHLIRQRKLNQKNIDFFNHMAHEFRTPLTNMQLAATRLIRKKDVSPENPYIEILQGENQRLLQQVERMLHIAKLEQHDLLLDPKTFSLPELLEKIVREMDLQAQAKGGNIGLSHNLSAPLPVFGDPLHISNAIRNLIDNALKYCEKEPNIQISLEQDKQFARLEVRDNGIGIDRRHQQSIFRKFFRIREHKRPLYKGFGLGLTYVKQVIELHQGFLQVDSLPEKGSTFRLFLPLEATV